MEETIATPVAAGAKGSPAAADGTIRTVEKMITTEDLEAVLVGLQWAVAPCRDPDVVSLLPEVVVQVIDGPHIGA
jgi:hypothetical protein